MVRGRSRRTDAEPTTFACSRRLSASASVDANAERLADHPRPQLACHRIRPTAFHAARRLQRLARPHALRLRVLEVELRLTEVAGGDRARRPPEGGNSGPLWIGAVVLGDLEEELPPRGSLLRAVPLLHRVEDRVVTTSLLLPLPEGCLKATTQGLRGRLILVDPLGLPVIIVHLPQCSLL